MQLSKVVGNVWATHKNEKLNGLKFLIVQHMNLDGTLKPAFSVAADSVGAGVGMRDPGQLPVQVAESRHQPDPGAEHIG